MRSKRRSAEPVEEGSQIALGLADVLRDQIGARADHQFVPEGIGKHVCELGLTGARRPVETQPAVAVPALR